MIQNRWEKHKLSLVNYLKNYKKYSVFKNNKITNNDVYLYDKHNVQSFQIVVIKDKPLGDVATYKFENDFIQAIKNKLNKSQQHASVKVLYIVLDNVRTSKKIINNNEIITIQENNWVKILSGIFPDIKKFLEEQETDISQLSYQDLVSGQTNPKSKLGKDMRKLSNRLSMSNLIITWVLLLLLVLVPVILYFAKFVFNLQGATGPVYNMALGGLSADWLLGANQWWRLFTYLFADSNLFLVVILGFLLFIIARYTEVLVKKWQMILTIVIAVPFAGFVLSITMPNYIISGASIVICALYGLMFMASYKKSTLTAATARSRTIYVPIFLAIYPFLATDFALYLIYFISFTIGLLCGFLFLYDWDNLDWTIGIPIFILLALFITPIVLIFVQPYIAHNNYLVFDTLSEYLGAKLMSKNTIISIMTKYYHIPLDQIGSYIHGF